MLLLRQCKDRPDVLDLMRRHPTWPDSGGQTAAVGRAGNAGAAAAASPVSPHLPSAQVTARVLPAAAAVTTEARLEALPAAAGTASRHDAGAGGESDDLSDW
jgi:hypothetical protein